MKKLLLLLFVFVSFFANAQDAELDNIYLRDAIYLQDSDAVAITEGDTLLTLEKGKDIISDSLGTIVSSQWDDVTGGINYAGGNVGVGTITPGELLDIDGNAIIRDTLKVTNDLIIRDTAIVDLIEEHGNLWTATGSDIYFNTGNVGIGTADPLSALHINKGDGTGTGVGFGPTAATEIYAGTGFSSIKFAIAGSERWQMTQTNLGSIQTGGARWEYEVASATNPVHTFVGDSDKGLGSAGADQLSLIAGGVEGLRINDAEAHSVAGITDYETLVTNDDDIPNLLKVQNEISDSIASIGSEGQIGVVNSTDDDLEYSSGLTYLAGIFHVSGLMESTLGRSISGDSHGATTQDALFDLLDSSIPNTNDEIIITGAMYYVEAAKDMLLMVSKAERSAPTTITIYGIRNNITQSIIDDNTLIITNGDATAIAECSLAW